jgi:hypothetical protein
LQRQSRKCARIARVTRLSAYSQQSYRRKQTKRVADRTAVRSGTAVQEEFDRVSGLSVFFLSFCVCLLYLTLFATLQFIVFKRQDGDYNHLIAMLRSIKALDPDVYLEV